MQNLKNWVADAESTHYLEVKRMDPWKHEDRSSIGGSSHLPRKPSRNRDSNQNLINRWNSLLCYDREWNKQIVTEMSEETQENRNDGIGHSAGRLAVKARPKQTSMPMSSSPTVTIPYHLREWIDVEPGEYAQSCFDVSKRMT